MRFKRSNERRGVILLVVLALLTLFAIVGITFVLYSDSEATAARIAREAETQPRADIEPENALAYFLSQLIYDVPDNATGVGSALRGHSLGRTMFGQNGSVPFNGVGRLHYPGPNPWGLPQPPDDYNLVNYTYFSGDGFVRDPEHVGKRASPTAAQTNPLVACNAPYTYPDLNNFFLGAIKADGTLITPSYHRKWLFNPNTPFNDMTNNPNWTNQVGKYLTARPRPQEHPKFPAPDDASGDVKNLIWAPGGNDSIWIDIGAPVMIAPDGTKYKMLVAPLILDLDNRINLHTAGNILGAGNTHRSHQGWGPWEVNLGTVLAADATEWTKLFVGNGNIEGKYGLNKLPGKNPASAVATVFGRPFHYYAQANCNALNESAPGNPALIIQPPGFGSPNPLSPWPNFGAGYGNGNPAELLNHPLLYSAFLTSTAYNSFNDDRFFRTSDMEHLLRPNSLALPGQGPPDTGSAALNSDLIRLCPLNFGPGQTNPRFRNMVTTLSADRGAPGLIPYWYSQNGAFAGPYPLLPSNPLTAPVGAPVPSPPIVPGQPFPNIVNNPSATPPNFSEFGFGWRAISNPIGQFNNLFRSNLALALTSYPQQSTGASFSTGRFDLPPPPSRFSPPPPHPVTSEFLSARASRQNLASSIYQHLLAVTGVGLPANRLLPDPGDPNLIARRWLAQLAVNIVDYIDEDDISTPFNFYTASDAGPQPRGQFFDYGRLGKNAQNQDDQELPLYWVFGTEQPKVVINEVLAEHPNVSVPTVGQANPNTDKLKIWVELYNTLQGGNVAPLQVIDNAAIPFRMPDQPVGSANTTLPPADGKLAFSTYNLVISNGLESRPNNDNVLGKPVAYPASQRPPNGAPLPQIEDFTSDWNTFPNAPKSQTGPMPPPAPTIAPGKSFLLQPLTPANPPEYADPFKPTATTVPPGTPVMASKALDYSPNFPQQASTPPDERQTGVTVLLRRLANPHIPFDPKPSVITTNQFGTFSSPNTWYNPYVTVDYISQVAVQDKTQHFTLPAAPPPPRAGTYMSLCKRQPYASLNQVGLNNPVNLYNFATVAAKDSPVYPQTAAPVNGVSHSFGRISNVPAPQSGHYDWMVHLDRVPISPMELLHVSGYQPYQLTQQFVTGANNVPGNVFQHYVPWFDQRTRLYRLFEFLTCDQRATGVFATGRIPGKININTLWEPEVFQAVCDANASNAINTPGVIQAMFQNLMNSRTPGWAANQLSANDNPFLGMGVGYTLPAANTQWPNGLGIQNTLLRTFPTVNPPPAGGKLLFQNPADTPNVHPYLQYEMLTKIYNNLTVRSNVFAVFLTVGFFEVTSTATTPPTLGAEIGRAEGRHVRHRMFAIVDRSNLFNAFPPTRFDPRTNTTLVPYFSIID